MKKNGYIIVSFILIITLISNGLCYTKKNKNNTNNTYFTTSVSTINLEENLEIEPTNVLLFFNFIHLTNFTYCQLTANLLISKTTHCITSIPIYLVNCVFII
ncbi:MAG: hypothetical protein CVT95_05795 [Bacteroidetes bacterium HGW-Bacteroidetes-12]|nr:MAG: hypothetical protein CVT95_05795 [Bacteroidetes bacterium HGW-Bacteroidetes-12]